eukprot:TRINITY_DN4058_c0_g1_i1.p1 TRINITY_DN4058_c0_g1~~TRINITY_DN4058_c0_g1_i1.p1  ORF type:complete len:506 (+),score=103.71 TRINITY_DN4058_c0_g1_i1:214-1518(+)
MEAYLSGEAIVLTPDNHWKQMGLISYGLYGVRNARKLFQQLIVDPKLWDKEMSKEGHNALSFITYKGEDKLMTAADKWISSSITDEAISDIARQTIKGLRELLEWIDDNKIDIDKNFVGISSNITFKSVDVKTHVTLNNGVKMPTIGFGTWFLEGDSCTKAVISALEAGYRRIDTADAYNNEEEVGKAIKKSGVHRSEIFIGTKILPGDYGESQTKERFESQLKKLGVDYIDLYMLHSAGENDAESIERRRQTWRVLEQYNKAGKIKALGVSNYDLFWFNEMEDFAHVLPSYVQDKYDPFFHGSAVQTKAEDLLAYLKLRKIVLDSYSPFSGWPFGVDPSLDPHIISIAKRHSKTPRQLVIRYLLQKGLTTIPRSKSEKHIQENIDVFDFTISEQEMEMIDGLSWFVASRASYPPLNVKDVYGVGPESMKKRTT